MHDFKFWKFGPRVFLWEKRSQFHLSAAGRQSFWCLNLSHACRDAHLSRARSLQLGHSPGSPSSVRVCPGSAVRLWAGVQEDKAHDNSLETSDRVTSGCSPYLEPHYTSKISCCASTDKDSEKQSNRGITRAWQIIHVLFVEIIIRLNCFTRLSFFLFAHLMTPLYRGIIALQGSCPARPALTGLRGKSQFPTSCLIVWTLAEQLKDPLSLVREGVCLKNNPSWRGSGGRCSWSPMAFCLEQVLRVEVPS